MAASATACPGCGDAVPYGRLSCASCGELLALVAGRGRRLDRSDRQVDRPEPQEREATPAVESDSTPAVWSDQAVPPTWPVAPSPVPPRWATPSTPAPAAPAPSSTPPPAASTALWSQAPTGSPAEVAAPDRPAAPAAARSEPMASPTVEPSSPFVAGPPIPPTGAYPPGAAFAAAGALPVTDPSLRASDARSWSLPSIELAALGSPGFQERVVVVGGGIATVAFFLPWAAAVIGSPPLPDPWDSFGIVGAWHLVPFLLTVGTVALSQFGERFPTWIRLALAPLLTAGVLLGLDWYYLVTPLGGWLGGYVLAVGAAVMAFGSMLAIRSLAKGPRNAEARLRV